ncbi:MAG: glycosyltransferase [Planctomycetota bacterium]
MPDAPKRLALVTTYYPPDGGGGAQRPHGIATHALACGWAATVFTREEAKQRSNWDPHDPTMAQAKTAETIVRVPVPEGSTAWRMVPPAHDGLDPWLGRVVDAVVAAHGEDAFDAVLVTMPPYGMGPVVPALKAALPDGPPVVLDLRDPWAFDGALSYRDKKEWRVNRDWMERVVKAADAVIVNTPEVQRRFAEAFPKLTSDRLTAVTNGFSLADFDGPRPEAPAGYEPGRFHLVHTGTLHTSALTRTQGLIGKLRKLRGHRAEPVEVSGRTALHLLRAVAQLKQNNAELYDRLSVVLVGVDDADTRAMVAASGVADRVTLTGYQPHDVSVAWVRWAEALFLPLHGLPAGHRSLIVPGKTYEYLAAGRPILAALPEGDARDFVERAGYRAVHPTDEAGLAERLAELMLAAPVEDTPSKRPSWLNDYDRQRLTERLFAFLDQVTERP